MTYHRSVLLEESISLLGIKPGGIYVDATYGGGGHSREILAQLGEGKLVAFDQDEEALDNRIDDPRLVMVNANFRYLRNFLKLHRASPCDGILADLGISSHQIDHAERGFSTRFDGRLDMRMDRKKPLTARTIINEYPEKELVRLFQEYGEIRNARKLAMRIAESRHNRPIESTAELCEIGNSCAERGRENKYLAQLFQALRMEVNQETEVLREFLRQASQVLKPGGRLVVIAYHSLEDKLVKNFIRTGDFEGTLTKDFYGNIIAPLKAINRKVIVPSDEEIAENNRARSAKLRAAEKVA
ncbi:MAG TPA: 16S rRNA (cytosine(1402)-N(4))-methyltransferase RsmH [Bacteroidales bacterium]|nr:16S rRNA (cytosine(1402)-N(4))-methyltransferase RsmH [Bacteroidales bacterium]HPS62722.1 16S rRNA (cytosine(1402)-N(4))-methyltransferase RsmH [Bacteroidales bacterium]